MPQYLDNVALEEITKKLKSQVEYLKCNFPNKADLVGGTVPLSQLPDSLGVTAFVATWADLPDPTLNSGKVYYVLASSGTPWWPPTYKSDGFWISNGVEWKYARGVPINASLAEALAGIEDTKFITPKILNDWYAAQPGGGTTKAILETYTAGEAINGGRAIIMDTDAKVYHMDITNSYHYERYIGISSQAAILNDPVQVVTCGITDVLGSGWVAGQPYYISSTGYLTTTAPLVGFCKQVAVGVDTDKINIVNYAEFILI